MSSKTIPQKAASPVLRLWRRAIVLVVLALTVIVVAATLAISSHSSGEPGIGPTNPADARDRPDGHRYDGGPNEGTPDTTPDAKPPPRPDGGPPHIG
jgi:hypothetical protein